MSVISVQQPEPKYHNMPMTSAQYFDLEDDGFRYELIKGRMKLVPSPLTRHQRILGELFVELRLFLRAHPIGEVYVAPLDVVLSPSDVYQPDLIFVRRENRHIITERRIEGAPDLVVEVLSQRTRDNDFGVKFENYAQFGVQEYWIVNPESSEHHFFVEKDRRFDAVSPESDRYTSSVIRGFVLDLAWLNRIREEG